MDTPARNLRPRAAKSPAATVTATPTRKRSARSGSSKSPASGSSSPATKRARKSTAASASPDTGTTAAATVSSEGALVNNSSPAGAEPVAAIDADEIYDRQIRLWGAAAQQRLRTARIVLVGDLSRGIAAEAAKNLALAGVGSLTLVDGRTIDLADTAATTGPNFFISAARARARAHTDGEALETSVAAVVADGARALNPMIEIHAVSDPAAVVDENVSEDSLHKWVAGNDFVIACDVPAPVLDMVNRVTRALGARLFAANVLGLNGFIFADLLQHDYFIEDSKPPQTKDADPEVVVTEHTLTYVPIWTALDAFSFAETVESPKLLARTVTMSYLALAAVLAYWRHGNRLSSGKAHEFEAAALLKEFQALASRHGVAHVYAHVTSQELLHMFRGVHTELVTVTSMMGGLLSQEVVRAIQGKGRPVANFFSHTGDTSSGDVAALGVVDVSKQAIVIESVQLSDDDDDE
ncbi:hypothetical protein BC828DRAFT_376575 [Blastocladiella britannica]|nr:hypothetical protein BC828DRAFT_376575 [Blastocladiella britannica]